MPILRISMVSLFTSTSQWCVAQNIVVNLVAWTDCSQGHLAKCVGSVTNACLLIVWPCSLGAPVVLSWQEQFQDVFN